MQLCFNDAKSLCEGHVTMLSEPRKRYGKAGLPPESMVYTGEKSSIVPKATLISYTSRDIQEKSDTHFENCLNSKLSDSTTWVNVEGLHNTKLIKEICNKFTIHPLIIEDILNVEQRPKIEEFNDYVYIITKNIRWNDKLKCFHTSQVSIIFGKDFLLSFHEHDSECVAQVQNNLRQHQGRVRDHGSDYLAYILLDTIVDQYFTIIDNLADYIELVEQRIINRPTQEIIHEIYHLKRQIFLLRKTVWPVREIINRLLQIKGILVTDFTTPYLRDVYDHSIQVIDSVESFRDILSDVLDVYLSNLTNRTNEVMKVLTIIATIFIPLTFIASIYGMNFEYMPELHAHYGYPVVLTIMGTLALFMLGYFRRKRWL